MEHMDADHPGERCDAAQGNAPGAFSPPLGTIAASGGVGGAGVQENAWSFLALARQLVDRGEPSLALQAVLAAIRSGGGEQAVFEILHQARELYRNRLQTDAAADELASLFAECAIAEAQGPVRSSNNPPLAPLHVGPSIPLDSEGRSFLAMSGRQQVMLDAFADGSSFVCLKCGGLVSTNRKDEHFAYWCS
ncbi:uncharacterized protein LOC122034803 [Zingiber officinale]|uniref:C2HC zinc finger plants domain-containing protein n=1 Tax=Zingiber officinale TaxID=94328 RepID=A0A8J5ELU6_ZINOF|nr:uncharacterized protein LOC122034803 [Zingiber officinale]KAG6467983.1 hypothetical protein ZIOFF_072548 [Zingiber officinale]